METVILPNDPAAVTVYSHRVYSQALRSCQVAKLGALSLNPRDQTQFVQYFDEMAKGPGAILKYDLLPNPQGPGVLGDGTIAGQEVPQNPFTDSFIIDQLRQPILLVGRMSQQRVPYSMRDGAKTGLANWSKEMLDYGFCNQAGGNTFQTTLNYTGLNPTLAPSADHWIIQGHGTNATGGLESQLGAGDITDLQTIPSIVAMARTFQFPIKPVVIKGIEVAGVLFLHPYQVRDLKKNFTPGQWGDIYGRALQGGQITGNPLFTGAIGMLDGTVIHEDPHVPWGDTTQNTVYSPQLKASVAGPNALGLSTTAGTTNVARGFFVGAQALAFACGAADQTADGKPLRVRWVEELLDGANQLRVTVGMVFGIHKTQFDTGSGASDYAVITYSSYAAPV